MDDPGLSFDFSPTCAPDGSRLRLIPPFDPPRGIKVGDSVLFREFPCQTSRPDRSFAGRSGNFPDFSRASGNPHSISTYAGVRGWIILPNYLSAYNRSIWQDEFAGDSVRYQWPGKDRTRRLILEEPREEWYDDITTPSRETLNTLVNRSFREARARHARLGSPSWAAYRPVQIKHLAGIDALGRLDVATGGCHDCVNALRAGHGPSWRMVVALGRQGPKAWGIYPGGQSGNPGSPRYDEFVGDWAQGKLYPLLYLSSPGDRPEEAPVRLFLEGK